MSFLNPTYTAKIDTAYGPFIADIFIIGGLETAVLHTDNIPGTQEDVLCRIQSECISHAFFDQSCDCAEQISSSLKRIKEASTGLLIYLRQEGMGLGISGKLAKDPRDWRSYFGVVEILNHYGIHSVQLISLNKRKFDALRGGGITVRSSPWHEGRTILLGDRIERTIEQVRLAKHEAPSATSSRVSNSFLPSIGQEDAKPRVLILGDLNIDHTATSVEPGVGGHGYNAAIALKKANYCPIIFGKVGCDEHGSLIRAAIQKNEIYCLLGIHEKKATGFVDITFTAAPEGPFQYTWEKRNNANDYDAKDLRQAIELAAVCDSDYAFVSSYLFVQKLFVEQEIKEVLRIISDSKAMLILDLVRKSFAFDVLSDLKVNSFDKTNLQNCLADVRLYAIIGELSTFNSLGLTQGKLYPDQNLLLELLKFFSTKWIICRYVEGPRLRQKIACLSGEQAIIIKEEQADSDMHVGLGDEMFANALGVMRTHDNMNERT
jgi:GTP cyclohydrolase II